jgi:exopolyphosphatase/guanosine-5'-triphosphate,3'-diphosphate pyrophosphatase
VRKAGLERLRIWASFLDPDVPHSRHVAQLALKIYDGLELCLFRQAGNQEGAREILRAAALMHEVGRGKSEKGHHKKSYEKIAQLDPLLGWSSEELALVAAVTRYHRGALPQVRHRAITALPRDRRKIALHLAAVLRLANAFDPDPGSVIPQIRVQRKDGFILINAKGYMPRSAVAEQLAAARHLLELVCNRPIIIRPLK